MCFNFIMHFTWKILNAHVLEECWPNTQYYHGLILFLLQCVVDVILDFLKTTSKFASLQNQFGRGIFNAASVFTTVAAEQLTDPAECSFKVRVLPIREAIAHERLRVLWWADTRDMLSDRLTKGGLIGTQLRQSWDKDCSRPSRSRFYLVKLLCRCFLCIFRLL